MSQLHQFDRSERRPDRPDATSTVLAAEAPEGEAGLDALPCTALPDAELTRLIRTDEPEAAAATEELRHRHLASALAYARICSRDSNAAEDLANEAFRRAMKAVQSAGGPREAWRHHLLIQVQRVAASWADTSRRAELAPDFAAWLDGIAAGTPTGRLDVKALESHSLMLRAFRTMPERTQAILWHAVVEEDQDCETALLLGMDPQSVPYLREKAREAYRDAYLHAHVEQADDDECRRFSGLVEAAARRSGIHQSEDLDCHLATCPRCSRTLTDLVGLGERPDAVLAEGLLAWGGAAYVAARLARAVGSHNPTSRDRRNARPAAEMAVLPDVTDPYGDTVTGVFTRAVNGWRPVRLARQFPAASAVAGVVVVVASAAATILALLPSNNSSVTASGAPLGIPPVLITPSASATATAGASGSASTGASASVSSPASPSVSAGASGSKHGKTHPGSSASGGGKGGSSAVAVPPPPTQGSTFTEFVNGASRLCLDVSGQFLAQGANVVVHTCTGATSQKWYLDSDHLIHNYANPTFCLDSRGAVNRGVGVWTCSSASGGYGNNLRFTFGQDGTIRPYSAPGAVLTPNGSTSDSGVGFAWAQGRPDQTWRKGASAVLMD